MSRRHKTGILGAMVALSLLVAAFIWLIHSAPHVAADYEECAGQSQAYSGSNVEYSKLITRCGERFAGRRKLGGGYTYFDFMQNRSFDIAGPNPTDDERKQIDRSYMDFLAAQHREAPSSDLAKSQADQYPTMLGHENAGQPLVLTPRIPLPVRRPQIERARSCEDGSLSCSWAKLSAAVRNAFASMKTSQ
jgi:hypothetical protein